MHIVLAALQYIVDVSHGELLTLAHWRTHGNHTFKIYTLKANKCLFYRETYSGLDFLEQSPKRHVSAPFVKEVRKKEVYCSICTVEM